MFIINYFIIENDYYYVFFIYLLVLFYLKMYFLTPEMHFEMYSGIWRLKRNIFQ